MQQVLEAVYENGVFRPLSNPMLAEGQTVQLVVQSSQPTTEEVLALAGAVYQGLSEQDIDEIEQISHDRSRFINPEQD